MANTQKKILYICGCARSGTSALWRLMTAHDKIAIGLERFIERSTDEKFSLSKDLFDKERFYRLEKGDTHFKSIEKGGQGEYYAKLKDRYDDCEYYGDKVPRMFRYYNNLFEAFPKVKVLFIYRNIFDVAQSFNARKQDPKDGWDRGYQAAVKDWNLSMRSTVNWIAKKEDQILPIPYEELFFGQYPIDNIFSFLEIEPTPTVTKLFGNLRKKAKEIEGKREVNLSSLQKKYIMKNARFNLFKKLVELSEVSNTQTV